MEIEDVRLFSLKEHDLFNYDFSFFFLVAYNAVFVLVSFFNKIVLDTLCERKQLGVNHF